MSRADEVDALLEEQYAKVPEINCKGHCADACGPIDGGAREVIRMRRAGVRLPPRRIALRIMAASGGNYECPALKDGQCSVYAVRPMICRVWGASDDMVCPHGCGPVTGRRLTSPEMLALLDAARTAGTVETPKPVEFFEERLAIPEAARMYRHLVRQPVATRPDSV